jgi:nucleotide-binding universal stress UspA family protein
MFSKVLVGIDDQTRGRDAIALARRLAATDAEITFAHVYPPVVSAVNLGGESPTDAAAATALLRSVAVDSGVHARTRCAPSVSVSDGLRIIADQVDADLLVIGGTTRNRMTRALLGNFTSDTLAIAGCTVAIAPQGYAESGGEIRRVGVAYDGSSPSEAALAAAHELSDSLQAELSAFNVIPAPHVGPLPRRHELEKAIKALKVGRAQIEAHEGVEAHVACGDPVQQLGGFSRNVDILVAGARGAGFLARLLHPSTTEALADTLKCPLLVITRGAREKERERIARRLSSADLARREAQLHAGA